MLSSKTYSTVSRGAFDALRTRRTLYLVAAVLLAGSTVAVLPSTATKIVLLAGVGAVVLAAVMARRGSVLDPAWVTVGQLCLLVPTSELLEQSGVELSIITFLSLVYAPFVLVAIMARPEIRVRLLLLVPLLVLVFFTAASMAWSPSVDWGTRKLTVFVVTNLLPAASLLVLFSARRSISWNIILVGSVVYAIGLFVLDSTWRPDSERLTILGQNPIWAARAVMVGAMIAILGPFRSWVRLVSAPILIVAGALTLSIGPALAMVVGVGTGAVAKLYIADRKAARLSAGWPALAIAAGVMLVFLASGAFDRVIGPLLGDPNVTARADYLEASVPIFLGAPLFGAGFGGFEATGLDLYPHNIVAEVATELGIIGLFFLAIWLLMALRGAIGSPLMLGLVTGTFTFALFSGSLAGQEELFLFTALAVARLAWPVREQPDDDVHRVGQLRARGRPATVTRA